MPQVILQRPGPMQHALHGQPCRTQGPQDLHSYPRRARTGGLVRDDEDVEPAASRHHDDGRGAQETVTPRSGPLGWPRRPLSPLPPRAGGTCIAPGSPRPSS